MIFGLPYKPASDGSGFIMPDGYKNDADSNRIRILRSLSAVYAADEMSEYADIPAEWLNVMFADVLKWGINGELIQNFLTKISSIADSDPKVIETKFDESLKAMKGRQKQLLKAVDHVFDSVNESYPIRKGNNQGIRYNLMSKGITSDAVSNYTVYHPLDEIINDYPALIVFVLLALSCQDRVGKFGSTFRKKDYDLLTNVWQEYITPISND